MIDEEFYRIANEELNSDQRRSKIWARACALARDDHDEARYLYTNLRVEEMMAERDGLDGTENAAETVEEKPEGKKPRILLDPSVMAQANELVDEEQASLHNIRLESSRLANQEFGDLDVNAIEQFSSSTQSAVRNDPQPTQLNDESANALSDLAATSGKLTDSEFQALGDTPLDLDLPSTTDAGTGPTESTAAEKYTSLELELPNTTAAEEQLELDDLDLDSTIVEPSLADQEPSVYQADSADSATHTPQPTHEQVARDQDSRRADLADLEARAHEEAVSEHPVGSSRQSEQPGISHDYADNSDLDTAAIDAAAIEDQINADEAAALDSGPGAPFLVFSDNEGRTKAVKRGVSWSAMFLTFPWLLSKSLFGTAIVYALLWVVLVGGLLITGLDWMDAGAAASTATKLATALFALMILIGLVYLPFRFGNSWVAQKLISKRFDYQTAVRAKSRKDAIDKVLQFAA